MIASENLTKRGNSESPTLDELALRPIPAGNTIRRLSYLRPGFNMRPALLGPIRLYVKYSAVSPVDPM
jgi:hypothetical protein